MSDLSERFLQSIDGRVSDIQDMMQQSVESGHMPWRLQIATQILLARTNTEEGSNYERFRIALEEADFLIKEHLKAKP